MHRRERTRTSTYRRKGREGGGGGGHRKKYEESDEKIQDEERIKRVKDVSRFLV